MSYRVLFIVLIVLQLIGIGINLVLISGRKKKLEEIKNLRDVCEFYLFKGVNRYKCEGCDYVSGRVGNTFKTELKQIEKKENQDIKD